MVVAYFVNPFNDQFQNMLPAVLNIITPIPDISGWRISFESGFWSTSFRPQPITSIHEHPSLFLEKSGHFSTSSFIKLQKKSLMKDCNNFGYAVIVTQTKLVWQPFYSNLQTCRTQTEKNVFSVMENPSTYPIPDLKAGWKDIGQPLIVGRGAMRLNYDENTYWNWMPEIKA